MCKHGSSCVHSAPPPIPGRDFSLSFPLCVTCAHPRRGSVDAPSVVNSSRHRLDQQDAKTAHTWFYPAAGKPFDGIAIIRSSKDKLHQSGKIPQTVYTLRGGHTLPQEKKSGIFVLGQRSQNIFFYGNVQTCGVCETLLCNKPHFFAFQAASSQG